MRQPDGRMLVQDSVAQGRRSATGRRRWRPASSTTPRSRAVDASPSIRAASSGRWRRCRAAASADDGIEIGFYLSPTVHDGRFANNAWLQELPSPVGKLTWDNAALMSPATAGALGASDGDLVQVEAGGRSLRVPALVVPGHADRSLSLWLGYGRHGHERVAAGVGVNAYPLRTPAAPWFVAGAARKVAGQHALALTQEHWAMVDRKGDESFALRTTSDEIAHVAHVTAEHRGDQPSFFSGPGAPPACCRRRSARARSGRCRSTRRSAPAAARAWSRARRRTTCPVVGRDGVRNGREMHWLRIDTLLQRRARRPAGRASADAVPALRERAVRVRVPGQRDRAQPRRPQRDGLQPLRRHAVLLEQLPVQGAALQLVRLRRTGKRPTRAGRCSATPTSPCARAA